MGFSDLISRLHTEKTLQTSYYDNEFVVTTVNRILENLSVNSDCKEKKCIENETLTSGCIFYK